MSLGMSLGGTAPGCGVRVNGVAACAASMAAHYCVGVRTLPSRWSTICEYQSFPFWLARIKDRAKHYPGCSHIVDHLLGSVLTPTQ